MSIDRRTWNTQNCLVNLPIVRIDPNNRRQRRQPIATREVIRVRATATYPVLVVVGSSRIHEYTTALNVDNLWWNLCSHDTCHSIVDTHGRVEGAFDTTKSSCTRTLLSYRFYYAINNFCHLELFNLSSLLFPLQLLFRYHSSSQPSEFLHIFCCRSRTEINFFN